MTARRDIAEPSPELPAPDLQALVAAYGGYDRIPPEAWAAYQRELAEWRARIALGDSHPSPYRYRGLQR